ncbi:DUF3369 domain-containing protein [Sulfurimonas sp. SAG-AH-194-C21]|nr:HD domain-containing phosphohydrolase [Sulfurimonas sp. SAG-AH-194-C21]MDF1882959.1 DUF3369 domain-containing protein [Sulfurimonas sp. SAG-AH-194-C21]
MFNDDGFLQFKEVEEEELETLSRYKVLIVDDEPSIHDVTKLVLRRIEFQGRKLELYHAYSAKEAEEKLVEVPDIAVILLDVVMETDSAGLDLVKVIREKLHNDIVRIILRTGQPGQAPEERVIVDYDINDYKNKSELTSEKLFSSMITALRSYSGLVKIEKNKLGLEKVLASTASIIHFHSIDTFFAGLLEQVVSLIHDPSSMNDELSVYMAFYNDDTLSFETGMGVFSHKDECHNLLELTYKETIAKAVQSKSNVKNDKCFVMYNDNGEKTSMLMLFDGDISSLAIEESLLNIFVKNIVMTYDNLLLSYEIKESQKETIFMLSEMAEQRSRETGMHVKRVAYFAKEIAEELGLSSSEVEEVFCSAPMHDIGKIAIPDRVLKKPGKLTDDEFELMKSHAQKGYDLLHNSDKRLMKVAAVVAHEHHERYDGKGYPQGLKGSEIHVYAQITALCDVFDALSSKRVYKDAWPMEKVLNLIKEESGHQFDPKVVDAFLARLDTILELLEEYADNMSDEAFNFEK